MLALDRSTFPYPYLMSVLQRLVELPQFTRIEEPAKNRADGFRTTADDVFKANPLDGPATFSKYDGKGPLVVRVFSFSYKNGIPEDESATAEAMSSTAEARTTRDAMSRTRN